MTNVPRPIRLLPILLLALTAVGGAARVEAAMVVELEPSPAGPAPVGTMVRWRTRVTGGSADLWYRFRVVEPGGAVRMIRDFGPVGRLDWTALDEGLYGIELTVRDRASTEVETVVSNFELVSRVGAESVVSSTSHPLVFLFSSPGCDSGQARVRFGSVAGPAHYTRDKPCVPGHSLNFYLAGLAANASYSANLDVEDRRNATEGPAVTFATGDASFDFAPPEVLQSAASPGPERILLQAALFTPPFATDLDGNLIWYGPPDLTYLTRPEVDGTFFGLVESRTDPALDVFRKFDLVGMTVLETNAARVSEQLVAMGKPPITGFHHEVRSISGGRIAVLGGVERILTGVQGPGHVDVLGDMIVVFDADLQVVWSWDTFDHLDTSRRAVLGETCVATPGACAPYYLAADANDWTHGNSVAEAPDGALIYSTRHQDWVIKIDYAGGQGNGHVIWRLGKFGDFTFDSADPYPWSSHQHDVEYEAGQGSTISLFDNGNTRVSLNPGEKSRGQVIELDEPNRIAHLALNADLGFFSIALGSAQRLAGGHYHFDAGFVPTPQAAFGGVGYALEVAPPGDILSSIKTMEPVYRSFRVADLYGPPEPEPPAPARPGTRVVDFRE
jgi:hypothetical protein